jgi:hypothetical protein
MWLIHSSSISILMRIYADDGRRPEKMLHVEQQEQLEVNHRRQGGSNSRRPSTVVHRSRLTTAPPPSTTAPGTSIRPLNLSGSIRPALPPRRPRTRTTVTPRQPPGVTGGKVGQSPSLARSISVGTFIFFLFGQVDTFILTNRSLLCLLTGSLYY